MAKQANIHKLKLMRLGPLQADEDTRLKQVDTCGVVKLIHYRRHVVRLTH